MQMARCRDSEDAQYRVILGVLKQFLGSEAFSKEKARSQNQPATSPREAQSASGEETAADQSKQDGRGQCE